MLHDRPGAGAYITALNFFFDESQKIRLLLTAAEQHVFVPSTDGLSLNAYTGADRHDLDINGELLKLGDIINSHGIHFGIHFRSLNYWAFNWASNFYRLFFRSTQKLVFQLDADIRWSAYESGAGYNHPGLKRYFSLKIPSFNLDHY